MFWMQSHREKFLRQFLLPRFFSTRARAVIYVSPACRGPRGRSPSALSGSPRRPLTLVLRPRARISISPSILPGINKDVALWEMLLASLSPVFVLACGTVVFGWSPATYYIVETWNGGRPSRPLHTCLSHPPLIPLKTFALLLMNVVRRAAHSPICGGTCGRKGRGQWTVEREERDFAPRCLFDTDWLPCSGSVAIYSGTGQR